MNKVDGNRSFAHSRGHSLYIARANIPHRKHAGKARFQHLWRTGQGPQRSSGGGVQITPRKDEPFVIEGNATAQPLGPRGCSRHDEYVANRVDRSFAVQLILPSDAVQLRATTPQAGRPRGNIPAGALLRQQWRALVELPLMRRRGETIERSFAHVYDTGGMRRTHLRGHTNILKRLLIHAGGFNLGLVMRQIFGVGTPRGLQGRLAAAIAIVMALWTLLEDRWTRIAATSRSSNLIWNDPLSNPDLATEI